MSGCNRVACAQRNRVACAQRNRQGYVGAGHQRSVGSWEKAIAAGPGQIECRGRALKRFRFVGKWDYRRAPAR